MTTKAELALSGRGNLKTVVTSILSEHADNEAACQAIHGAYTDLAELLSDERTHTAALAICCAVLNQQFEERGWLHSVTTEGRYENSFIIAANEKSMFAALLELSDKVGCK